MAARPTDVQEPEDGILVIEFTEEDLADTEYKPREEPDKYGPDGIWIGNGWMTIEDVRR